MKRLLLAAGLLLPVVSLADPAPAPAVPPAVEAWQMLYHREANQHAADMTAAITKINDLQRQLDELKAAAAPAADAPAPSRVPDAPAPSRVPDAPAPSRVPDAK
jgi:hypothetical protein